MDIQIPYNFTLRPYQRNTYEALEKGFNRAVVVWHRRAGKDKVFLNICVREALKRRGSYFYILPYYAQARKIIWEGMDKEGFRNIDHFPAPLIEHKNNQEMVLELKNGSFVRFLGSDNIDAIVGTNPVGVIFSEFSLHKVQAWNYLRPILLENNGWAMFNGTPRGKNHLYNLLQAAHHDPNWFVDVKTIEDTHVMTPAQVEEEIANGMPRALALQEFYCSFEAAMTGAYYGPQMEALEAQGRLDNVSYDPTLPVNTAWDLGISDQTTIWLFQQPGFTDPDNNRVNIIAAIMDNGQSLQHYVRLLKDTDYTLGYHLLPHDVMVRELSTGNTRLQTLRAVGLNNCIVVPKLSVEDGIAAVRNLLPRCNFNGKACGKGIEALKQYRAAWDETNAVYGKPIHDWSSHFADAFRMLAVGIKKPSHEVKRPKVANGVFNYDPLATYVHNNNFNRPSSYL